MSILIKGMEMPKRCLDCPFMVSRDNDDCILQTEVENELARTWEELKASCPLVEIPTPHGRLGDLDELINGCEKLMRMLDPESKEYLRVFAIKSYLMWAAEYAVIEAEGREKE